MRDEGRKNVLGVLVNVIDYAAVVARVLEAGHKRQDLKVTALAVHGLTGGARNLEQRYRLNQFDIIAPDGQPVRWALNWLHGVRLRQRVYGPDLMLHICAGAAESGQGIFLFGSSGPVLRSLSAQLSLRFPALHIAGTRASSFRKLSAEEREALLAEIRDSGAQIAFVGLGCPRQEVWTFENACALGMPVIAVGAAFDFNANLLKQAPVWMQRYGLEWLFRLSQEPRRLFRRYVYLNSYFLLALGTQMLRIRRWNPAEAVQPTNMINYG